MGCARTVHPPPSPTRHPIGRGRRRIPTVCRECRQRDDHGEVRDRHLEAHREGRAPTGDCSVEFGRPAAGLDDVGRRRCRGLARRRQGRIRGGRGGLRCPGVRGVSRGSGRRDDGIRTGVARHLETGGVHPAGDVEERHRVGGAAGQLLARERPRDAVGDVLAGDRFPVLPRRPRAQGERPRLPAVGRGAGVGREVADEPTDSTGPTGRVARQGPAEQAHRDGALGTGVHPLRVPRGDRLVVEQSQRATCGLRRGRRVRRARAGTGEKHGRKEQVCRARGIPGRA